MTDINDISHTSTLAKFEDAVTAQLRAQLASARKALEITQKMIQGEPIENGVIDTQTMQSLGQMIAVTLKGLE